MALQNNSHLCLSHPSHKKIFVGGLPWACTDQSLMTYFNSIGCSTTFVDIKVDRLTGKPRGFCYIGFDGDDDVTRCVEKARSEGVILEGRRVDVKPCTDRGASGPQAPTTATGAGKAPGGFPPSGPGGGAHLQTVTTGPVMGGNSEGGYSGPGGTSGWQSQSFQSAKFDNSNKLFVGGLIGSCTTDDMRAHFAQFALSGELEDCIVMTDFDGISKNFGFVRFKTKEDVDRALEHPAHVIMGKQVEIRIATVKSQGPPGSGGPGGQEQEDEELRSTPVTSGRGKHIFRTPPNPEFLGLSNQYGRAGWKAGYGTFPFGAVGKGGFGLDGWDGSELYDIDHMRANHFSQFHGNREFFMEVGRRVKAIAQQGKSEAGGGKKRKKEGKD